MMDEGKIVWLLLQLLNDTRKYRGVSFDCGALSAAEQIKYASGLIAELPGYERVALKKSFNRICDAVAAIRLTACSSTHQAPRAMQ